MLVESGRKIAALTLPLIAAGCFAPGATDTNPPNPHKTSISFSSLTPSDNVDLLITKLAQYGHCKITDAAMPIPAHGLSPLELTTEEAVCLPTPSDRVISEKTIAPNTKIFQVAQNVFVLTKNNGAETTLAVRASREHIIETCGDILRTVGITFSKGVHRGDIIFTKPCPNFAN